MLVPSIQAPMTDSWDRQLVLLDGRRRIQTCRSWLFKVGGRADNTDNIEEGVKDTRSLGQDLHSNKMPRQFTGAFKSEKGWSELVPNSVRTPGE